MLASRRPASMGPRKAKQWIWRSARLDQHRPGQDQSDEIGLAVRARLLEEIAHMKGDRALRDTEIGGQFAGPRIAGKGGGNSCLGRRQAEKLRQQRWRHALARMRDREKKNREWR